MAAWRLAAGTGLAVVILLAFHSTTSGNSQSRVEVTPDVVEVGVNFGGADMLIEGADLHDAEILVKVSAEPVTVKLSKKGKVMGIFWMTTERAVVENMPAFHALFASQSMETLLSNQDQVRIGVDRECTGIMSQARVTADSADRQVLPAEQGRVYVTGLRDIYIKTGRYKPCVSCHQMRQGVETLHPVVGSTLGTVDRENGRWSLRFRLPPDTPLGKYMVDAYYIKRMQPIDRQTADFEVRKTGLVEFLGTMATYNAVGYGVLSIVVAVFVGLGIGFIFPKAKH